jgi:hypothetical protein
VFVYEYPLEIYISVCAQYFIECLMHSSLSEFIERMIFELTVSSETNFYEVDANIFP